MKNQRNPDVQTFHALGIGKPSSSWILLANRQLLAIALTLLPVLGIQQAAAFNVGARVQTTTSPVMVRTIVNGVANPIQLGVVYTVGTKGTVISGDYQATLNGVAHTWNLVSWDDLSLVTGWVVIDVLGLVTPTLSFTSLTPSFITANTAPYDATLSVGGANCNNVNQVAFTWNGAVSGSATWNRGDTSWNSKVSVLSDTSMTLQPRVVESSPTWSGTVNWTVTLRDTTGATASRSFTVTYTPPPTLSFTSLTPSTITANSAPYDATLSVGGANFNNVNQVAFAWSGAVTGSATWNRGDSSWNAKVTVLSDMSMTLQPRVVEASPAWSGTVNWTVTLRDTTGATASRSFVVTYTPAQPVLSVTPASPPTQPAAAGSLGLNVNNTGSGSMSYSASVTSGSSWLSISSGGSGGNSGTIVVAYKANDTGSTRTGKIQVTASGATGSPLTVTLTQAAGGQQRLAGIKIGVDPGHGGSETGAVGPTGLTEKSVNLATALALKAYLEADGATVIMTRTTDIDVSLPSRSQLFINSAVNYAISVHHNAGGSSLDTTMAFIYCGASLTTRGRLASDVVQRLGTSTTLPLSTYPASTSDTLCSGCSDWLTGLTGVGQANLHMVREPELGGNIPSILAEISFISNPAEETKLRNLDYLDGNGWAIYAGLADYLGFSPLPRSGTPPVYNTPFLTDAQLENSGSMSEAEIRGFLGSHNSYFSQSVPDIDGAMFDTASIIASSCNTYSISPQVILTTLEKENNGVTQTARPSDTTMKNLMGVGSGSTARQQLHDAAMLLRSYQDAQNAGGSTVTGWKVGLTKTTYDGVAVTPATKAVAGQFTYTPYAGFQWGGNDSRWGGVYLFYHYWNLFGFGNGTPATYQITAAAGANGTISPSGTFTKNAGGSQTFTATPNATFAVDTWSLDGAVVQTGGTSYTLQNIQAPHTISVTFKSTIVTYQITATAGANGRISPSGTITKSAGDSQIFTATPNATFAVNTWSLDGAVVQTGGTSYTLQNIQAPHTVAVTFKSAIVTYQVTAIAGANGTISPSGTFTKNAGDSQPFIASPNATFAVDTWSLDGIVVQTGGTSYTLQNIQSTHSVGVTFKMGSDVFQYITFAQPPGKTYGDPSFKLTATASSGLPVFFTVISGPATLSGGNVLQLTGAGIVTVRASRPGDSGWLPATPVDRTFTVARAPLAAKADDKTKLQGTPNPPLTITYTGFVNGDQASALDSPPTASTTATTTSPAGSYPIILSGGSDDNYSFILQNGTLTITPSQPAVSVTFVGTDAGTRGNWHGMFGADGYLLANDQTRNPSYAQVTPPDGDSYTWLNSTTDPRALQTADGSGRQAACWFTDSSLSFVVTQPANQTNRVALYFLDWDSTSRNERVDIADAQTGAVLDSQPVTDFHNGKYLVWLITGSVTITVVNLDGNAVVSGLFFDPPKVRVPTWTILWEGSDGSLAQWRMEGTNVAANGGSVLTPSHADPHWQIVGTADFNGDGQPDLLWEHTDGWLAVWYMNGTTLLKSEYLNPDKVDPSWRVVAVADLNGDGHPDLVWERSQGAIAVWYMNGGAAADYAYFNPPQIDPHWRLAGVADLNGDGHPELLWENEDGQLMVWFMKGTQFMSSAVLTPAAVDPSWHVVGLRDVNGDGKTDLIWQSDYGYLAVWFMDGLTMSSPAYLNPVRVDPGWRIRAVR